VSDVLKDSRLIWKTKFHRRESGKVGEEIGEGDERAGFYINIINRQLLTRDFTVNDKLCNSE
jgi:hypothetical protein